MIDGIDDPEEQDAFKTLKATEDPKRRRALAEEFLQRYPKSWLVSFAHAMAAKASIALGDLEAGLEHGKRSVRILPENGTLLAVLANVQVQLGHLDDAPAERSRCVGASGALPRPRHVLRRAVGRNQARAQRVRSLRFGQGEGYRRHAGVGLRARRPVARGSPVPAAICRTQRLGRDRDLPAGHRRRGTRQRLGGAFGPGRLFAHSESGSSACAGAATKAPSRAGACQQSFQQFHAASQPLAAPREPTQASLRQPDLVRSIRRQRRVREVPSGHFRCLVPHRHGAHVPPLLSGERDW